MTTPFRPEPYVKVVPRSPLIVRAPRAAPRRMALTLLAALGIFWVPLLLNGWVWGALGLTAIPLALFATTFRGANTLRLDRKRGKATVRRHGFVRSVLLGEVDLAHIAGVTVDCRLEKEWEDSPLLPLSALLGAFGLHVHFGGREVEVPVWDLTLRQRTGDSIVVITSRDRESVEAARSVLLDKLGLDAGR